MNNSRHAARGLHRLLLAAAAIALGCKDSNPAQPVGPIPPPPFSITTPSVPTIQIPRTLQLSLRGGVDTGGVSWTSSDSAVASVTSAGVVTAKYPGAVTVTARRGASSATLNVTAIASSISIAPGAVAILVNATETFTAVVLDADHRELAGVPVVWSTGNAAIARVNPATGVLTGIAAGGTTVVATGGGAMAESSIHVTAVSGPRLAFSSIGSIGNPTCGLEASTGYAFCWGDNHAGALGSPSEGTEFPSRVSGDLRFSTLSVGDYATCGVEKDTGSAYCWGYNRNGDLGDGSTQTLWVPTLVASGPIRFKDISANGTHTCAVDASNGVGYCWGVGGLIGDGTTEQRLIPTKVGTGGAPARFSSISVGNLHSCGLEAETGLAYCWGRNTFGELGDGTTNARLVPTLVSGPLRFSSVSAGQMLTCGVEAPTGAGYCWGLNAQGQAGDGSTTNRIVPTLVAGGRRFSSISATGSAHACGLEVDTGFAYCWGASVKQATTSTTTAGTTPTLVSGATRFTSIVATYAGGCGVEAQTGLGYCWSNSQLALVRVPPPGGP